MGQETLEHQSDEQVLNVQRFVFIIQDSAFTMNCALPTAQQPLQYAPMAQEISFGTDGWRSVIADGFTFDAVRRVTEAVAVAARTLSPPAGIDRNLLIVGYDRRFLSREFAATVAEVLRAGGYRV